MSKKRRTRVLENPLNKVDISSLTDICFLLLIYFLVTSTIHISEKELSLDLPTKGQPSEVDALSINVESNGAISVGKADSAEILDTDLEDRSLPLLSDRVELYKAGADLANIKPLIELSVSDDTSQQRLIDVMNCLANLNISSITFNDAIND